MIVVGGEVTVDEAIDVEFEVVANGLTEFSCAAESRSPLKPSPTPTTPTAARAPAHFSIERRETSLTLSVVGSESGKIYFAEIKIEFSPIYPL